ncbi:hypothetical protein P175DRAFT_0560004 [Aspergillus ochraceoroseus IBT 24754]|uniref:DNA 3'-5' helicase n=1 Tax=Aspergillus ochraceoroseus IBT 24754 TaxID=1392256 RepID=A0A2T5LPA4_9EURO|nr:uncharacterized protein P175DRAFT_0560004 [Aspergillus ochraceoroseus IBT 24754]PTU18106.1 hypothetical protein P175DRAFT_0560004 [Aspergillus ochraceoroseus IBT 24754]
MRREMNRPFCTPRHGRGLSFKRRTNGQFPTSGQPQSSRIIDQKLIDGAQTPPALDTSQKQKFQLFYPDSGFIPAGEDGYNDDLQLDAFDLELLAHTDEPSGSIQSSSNTDHHSTYHQRQEHPPTQATLHRTLGSSSSDVDIGDASSALTRLQNGRAAAPFRDQDITTRRSHQDSQFRFTGLGTPHSYDNPDISSTMSSGKNTVFQNLPVSSRGIVLVSLRELPDNYRSLFHFPVFNAVQSKCFQSVYRSDDNLVLAAPTGSGKTVVMELAICRLLNNLKDERFKVIYQAPTKSLCSERFRDWNRKFHALGLQCAELTGDTDQTQLRHVQNSQIIVTTPEKWDSMTRKWKDHARLMQLVKLFLIDEVHTLKEARGATLEAVVSRMKSIGSTVRFIALSATIPNSEDIATWLGRNSTNQHVPAQREHFDEEFRPVKLQKVVYGYQSHSNDFAFDKMCNSKLLDIITTHSCRKPIMIFCCTRNSAVATAKELARLWSISNPPARLWKGLNKPMEVKNLDLKTTVSAGVGFHHAGLDAADRHQVENGFLGGQISIICCTSTLAVGVNLPCHLVIIKNTVGWQDGCCQEYSDLEIMQMLGRAGRPQFDDSATAVILTRKERVSHYEKLVSGSESLESCLHLNLIDHLNAEIGLGTVTDIESAIRWLAGTFLFVRLRRNPTHYQLREGANQDDEDEMLRQICQKDIKLLQECGLVTLEGLRSTPFGDAMARYYVRFKTMQSFLALNKQAGIAQILSAISEAEEFHNARLKVGEKTLYKEINRSPDISIPIKVDIALPAHKVSLLIQSELGAVEFPDGEQFQKYKFAFQQDKNFVFSHVNRLIRCIIDCQVHLQDSVTAMNALELARSLAAKVWDRSPLQIKQIEQVGVVAVRKLAANGITSIETLEETEPHQIDMILSRNPPFGVKLRGRLADFPKLRVSVKMTGKDVRPGPIAKIRFKAEIGFINEKCPKFFQRRPVHVCFLAEISDGYLIDFRRISVSGIQNSHEILLIAELKSPTQFVTCHVMCDEIAGTLRSAVLKPELPPSSFPGNHGKSLIKMADQEETISKETCVVKSTGTNNVDSFDSDDALFGEFLEAVVRKFSENERNKDSLTVSTSTESLLQDSTVPGLSRMASQKGNTVDSSSDYGSDGLSDIPSLSTLFFGVIGDSMKTDSQQAPDTPAVIQNRPVPAEPWLECDIMLSPVHSPLMEPLRKENTIPETSLIDLTYPEPQHVVADLLVEGHPENPCGWQKRKNSLVDDSRSYTKKLKYDGDSQVDSFPLGKTDNPGAGFKYNAVESRGLFEISGISSVSTDWEGIDPDLLNEFKDIVDFF